MEPLALYYSPGACSLAVHAALRQAGLGFRSVRIDVRAGEQNQPAFRALNPQGRVPSLSVGGRIFDQVVALAQLIDQWAPHAGLLPSEPLARAEVFRWMLRLSSDVHPLFRAFWRPGYFSADAAAHEGIRASARDRLVGELTALDAAIERGASFSAERPEFLDLFAAVFLRWSTALGEPSVLGDSGLAFRRLIARHPPLAAALEAEGVSLETMKRSTDP